MTDENNADGLPFVIDEDEQIDLMAAGAALKAELNRQAKEFFKFNNWNEDSQEFFWLGFNNEEG